MAKTRSYSKKREGILEVMRQTNCHPSAEWVYQKLKPKFPDLSLGTVYRNISLFKEEGTVISIGTVGGQERYDANLAPHAHLVCDKCGAVADVWTELPVDSFYQEVEGTCGGKILRHEVIFHGLCQNCLEAETAFIES